METYLNSININNKYLLILHTPPTEEISAIQRGRGDKIVSDNSKCIRTS